MRSIRTQTGTKASAHYQLTVGAGKTVTIWLRLSDQPPAAIGDPFGEPVRRDLCRSRRREADEFYRAITPARLGADEARVMRQALAGMLWTQAILRLRREQMAGGAWRRSDAAGCSRQMRNSEWFHMVNEHIISMPDKWEYPWYAAWDLAFHAMALSTVDVDFAKEQLDLLLQRILHASERADSGLRVEFQRCESAGACLGDDLPLQDRTGAARAKATWTFSNAVSKS